MVDSAIDEAKVEQHDPVVERAENDGKERQFPCHQCGAWLKWTPDLDSLSCPYCGHQEELPQDQASIQEYAFNDYLVEQGKAEGLGVESRAIKCGSCAAEIEFEASHAASVCPFCGSNAFDETAHKERIQPEAIIPFRVNQERARQLFREWLSKRWFAPSNLSDSVRADAFQGLYRPWWTFDSNTVSHWSGHAGEWHYETKTRTNSDGETETYEERYTVWHYRSGTYQKFIDDELTPGFKDTINAEKYKLDDLAAYDTAMIAGYLCERYVLDPKEAWTVARAEIERRLEATCKSRLGGDEQRGFMCTTAHSGIMFKSILLPVWQSAYRYKGKVYQIRVNGQNGNVTAKRPYSWMKITLTILLGLALLLIVIALFSQA